MSKNREFYAMCGHEVNPKEYSQRYALSFKSLIKKIHEKVYKGPFLPKGAQSKVSVHSQVLDSKRVYNSVE